MFKSRTFLLKLFLLASFTWLSSSGLLKRAKANQAISKSNQHDLTQPAIRKLQLKAADAKKFVQQNEYNDVICFLIDMSPSSGQNRFFVYDLKKDTLKNSGLVTHGRCNENWLEGRKYGNSIGCGCTSLGKYRIGQSYNGRFGLAYKLFGLEKTNDNAYKRFVVLHAHECVPEAEVEDEICQSDGCPTVSTGFLQYIKPIIDVSNKPVLLWIYE
jgi:hypothetical protein